MNVIVIGGGASGLMAAHTAAKKGYKVTLIEHTNRVGKKILTTGGGRCNISNVDMKLTHFHGGNLELVENVLSECGKDQVLQEFTRLGLYTINKNGYLYPYNEQASTVLDILRLAIKYDGVEIITDANVKEIIPCENKKYSFKVITESEVYKSDKLIICTGSKASSKTGSDGSGYILAKKLGHSIKKVLPALCALKCDGDFFKSLAGIRVKGSISIYSEDQLVDFNSGEIQLTNYGLSGIPAMQVSHHVARLIDAGEKVTACVSFMPEFTEELLVGFLENRINNNPNKTLEEFFVGMFHKNISALIIKTSGINKDINVSMINRKQLKKLCSIITSFKVIVTGTNSFEESQVCQGGIELSEIKNTLESKLVSGLYFAGEILDVHGDCGGYNLQWAFSSGMLAGRLE